MGACLGSVWQRAKRRRRRSQHGPGVTDEGPWHKHVLQEMSGCWVLPDPQPWMYEAGTCYRLPLWEIDFAAPRVTAVCEADFDLQRVGEGRIFATRMELDAEPLPQCVGWRGAELIIDVCDGYSHEWTATDRLCISRPAALSWRRALLLLLCARRRAAGDAELRPASPPITPSTIEPSTRAASPARAGVTASAAVTPSPRGPIGPIVAPSPIRPAAVSHDLARALRKHVEHPARRLVVRCENPPVGRRPSFGTNRFRGITEIYRPPGLPESWSNAADALPPEPDGFPGPPYWGCPGPELGPPDNTERSWLRAIVGDRRKERGHIPHLAEDSDDEEEAQRRGTRTSDWSDGDEEEAAGW